MIPDVLLSPEVLSIGAIIVIDIVLSGDNAIAIGMAVHGLPDRLRRRAIFLGVAGATILRIVLAALVFYLLAIPGMTLFGGLLLTWVCWRMWTDLRAWEHENKHGNAVKPPAKSLSSAMTTIIIADVSMSLDNVLAVAGAARGNIWILGFGLALSIVLMACAAVLIARLMETHRWIGYIGLFVIVVVAGDMVWRGVLDVQDDIPRLLDFLSGN